jgi:nicotinamidase-related amidase
MGLLEVERSLVVVIDMQGKLVDTVYQAERTLRATDRLLQLADLFAVPVVLTEQYPQGLGATHPLLRDRFADLSCPTRRVEKDAFGCCEEPAFESALRDLRPQLDSDRRQFVIAGIEAHVCVMQTVLACLDTDTEVFVCWECVSGRGEEYRRWALERMQQAGATLTNHESVGFEWARSKHHPSFRAMSQLFKEGQLT